MGLVDKCTELFAAGNVNGVVKCCDDVLKVHKSAEAHYLKGTALYRLGKKTEALAELESATGEDPTYALAWLAKGNLHLEESAFEKALSCYDECIILRPGEVSYIVLSSMCYALLGKGDVAVDMMERATLIDPHSTALMVKSIYNDQLRASLDLPEEEKKQMDEMFKEMEEQTKP